MKKLLLTCAAGLALTGPLSAALFQYHISGEITNAPNVPNPIPGGPQWNFDDGTTFSGSFIADCHKPGPISSFTLEIGGVDVVGTHSVVLLNGFDPEYNYLFWAALTPPIPVDGRPEPIDPSFISLGYTTMPNPPKVPFDRIVAVQNTDPSQVPPDQIDPVWLRPINFEGTFQVTKGVRVPDTGPTILSTSAAFGILLLVSGLRGRKTRRNS